MTAGAAVERLYTSEVLALAVELANFPLAAELTLRAQSRSSSCGSTLQIGLSLDSLGLLVQVGMQVSACAIGQASAAIFARHAKGMNEAAITNALHEIEDWLAGTEASLPWPDLKKIERARDYPARHGAILLPWRAAQQALSKAQG